MLAIIGIIFAIAIFITAILIAGGHLLLFFDIPSLLLVLGFDSAALLVSGQIKAFGLGLKTLIAKQSNVSKDELLAAAEVFDLMFKCSIGGGIIGFIMGLVMLLVNLNDPNNIGPYLAVAILTVFYGLILAYFIFLPGKVKLVNLAKK